VKHFSDSNLAIVGTARNVSKYIRKIHKVLCDSSINFKSTTFFIVESYSDDSTIEILKEIADSDNNFFFESLSSNRLNMPPLSVRIAEARNHAANMAQTHGDVIDYVLVADLDNVNSGLTSHALESCWNHEGWDMMSANQPYAYYDTWAFRHPILSPGDCWRNYDSLLEYFSEDLAFKYAVGNRVLKIPASSKPIPVESAFGGLAIYRSEKYFKYQYSGLDQNGREICEHVTLHNDMIQAGCKLLINPAMVNLRPRRQRLARVRTSLRSRQ
jgi:glycosyltransferase involved in cell wall biosynthesis